MAKSPLERQLEAQMKQEKQLANKQKREGERRAREQKKMEREAMIRERAASIVNGQPIPCRSRLISAHQVPLFGCHTRPSGIPAPDFPDNPWQTEYSP